MLQKYKQHIWLPGLAALILLLSACGTSTQASNVSPQQTLENSAVAMSQLKAAHFDLQATLKLQSTSSSNGMTFNVTGNGDASTTSKQADVNLLLGKQPWLSLISTGGKVYVQSNNGAWHVTDQSKISGTEKIFSQNMTTVVGGLLSTLKNATLSDKGSEVLNGETLDHIVVTLDAKTLKALSAQFNGLLPTNNQSTQNELSQTTLDLWIDTTTWYVHQAVLNASVQVDLSKLPQINFDGQNIVLPATVLPVTLKAQINFSKFNQAVNIQAPANATPTP